MQCHEFNEVAGPWLEGERPAAAQAHLSECARCRGLVAELTAIQAAAGELEAEVEPPAHLWTSIRTQLEAEGIIREPSLPWSERLAEFFRPAPRLAVAGAYLMAVLVVATMVSLDGTKNQEQVGFMSASVSRLPALAPPAEGVVHSIEAQSPVVAASYRDSLRTIDSFILECEKVVRQNPGNDLARDYLFEAHQQRAELLTAMVERGAYGE